MEKNNNFPVITPFFIPFGFAKLGQNHAKNRSFSIKAMNREKIQKKKFEKSVERKTQAQQLQLPKTFSKTFLEAESNSKMAPGRKYVVNPEKGKKQIRYLCDSLHIDSASLHANFRARP